MAKPDVQNTLETAISHNENHEIELGETGEKLHIDLIGESQYHHEKSALEKRVVRKADAVIIPLAALAYFASYLVRNIFTGPYHCLN